MGEELLKRNTDCVYFLASPFTCKKGADCEYRHSDMARLNPRDCWYWLSGNCLNPTCAFRHPPLETHTEASSEAAASSLNQSSAPVTKSTVPCYYHFNGFCSKAERCPFLHEPEETYSWKPKPANTITDASVSRSETKTSVRTDTQAPTKKTTLHCEEAIKTGRSYLIQQIEQAQKPSSKSSLALNSSAQNYVSKHEEAATIKRMSLQPAEGLNRSDREPSLGGSEHNSEELVEWLESSPGFDVLVDGKTEDLGYKDDPEYLHALGGSDEDREFLFSQLGYADQIDYSERRFIEYDPDKHLDVDDRPNVDRYSPRRTLDRNINRGYDSSHKRNYFPVDLPVGGRNDLDLRDYLSKRRMVDGYLEKRALRRELVHSRGERQDRLGIRAASNHRLHRRIASKVERNGVGYTRRRTSVVSTIHQTRPRTSNHNGLRQYTEMRKRPPSRETQRRPFSIRKGSPQDSVSFAGPKSLALIKEEKRAGHSMKNGSVDFEGPKPLSEILKNKKNTSF